MNHNVTSITGRIYNYGDSLEVLNLPKPVERALLSSKILTLGKFYKVKRKRLLKIKNIGPKTVSFLMKVKRSIDFDEPSMGNEVNKKTEGYYQNNDNIEILGLPLRIENSLKNVGIKKISELLSISKEDLLLKKNLGPKSISIIKKLI